MAKSQSLKLLTIEHSSLKKTVYLMSAFLDQPKIGSVTVANTKELGIKEWFVTSVELKLRNHVLGEKEWAILVLPHPLFTSGFLRVHLQKYPCF